MENAAAAILSNIPAVAGARNAVTQKLQVMAIGFGVLGFFYPVVSGTATARSDANPRRHTPKFLYPGIAQVMAKSDRQMKMVRRALMAAALFGFYVMMKVKG